MALRGCVTGQLGFLKLIYNRNDGKVLGVHIAGENACDLVNYGAEVVNAADTIFDMLQFVFPAVTYHELYHLAATQAKIQMKTFQSPHYNLLVLGAGPAGVKAAVEAANR